MKNKFENMNTGKFRELYSSIFAKNYNDLENEYKELMSKDVHKMVKNMSYVCGVDYTGFTLAELETTDYRVTVFADGNSMFFENKSGDYIIDNVPAYLHDIQKVLYKMLEKCTFRQKVLTNL